jgi:hypothetical protein
MTVLPRSLAAFALGLFGALMLAGVYAELHRAPGQS